jgi:Tfp pilus assembly protein PilX
VIAARSKNVRRGSVLVPIVAAMLILLLTGVALVELFAAQRMRSVIGIEGTRAYWIAEAGLWHAVYEDNELLTPVAFGGGAYTVARSGVDFTSTGTLGGATRVVSEW